MKKIYLSFIAILVVVATVAVSAYALFSSSASVQGITISTGSAGLKIKNDQGQWTDSWIFNGNLTGLAPNSVKSFTWEFKNTGSESVPLDVTGQIIGHTGDWDALKILNLGFSGNNVAMEGMLSDWENSPKSLGLLNPGQEAVYTITFSVPDSGNEISGKSVTGLKLSFVGTQSL